MSRKGGQKEIIIIYLSLANIYLLNEYNTA
jgi:hypothetical protein